MPGAPPVSSSRLITDAIIDAYLRCPLKAHHLLSGRAPPSSEHEAFAEQLDRPHLGRVRRALPESAVVLPLAHEDLSTHPDGLERVGKSKGLAPVRIFPRARLSEVDRLTLGFDGLVMRHLYAIAPASSRASKRSPPAAAAMVPTQPEVTLAAAPAPFKYKTALAHEAPCSQCRLKAT